MRPCWKRKFHASRLTERTGDRQSSSRAAECVPKTQAPSKAAPPSAHRSSPPVHAPRCAARANRRAGASASPTGPAPGSPRISSAKTPRCSGASSRAAGSRARKSAVEKNNYSCWCAMRHQYAVKKGVCAGFDFLSLDEHRAPPRTKRPLVCPILSRPRQEDRGGRDRRVG